jgi:hypothetical protein
MITVGGECFGGGHANRWAHQYPENTNTTCLLPAHPNPPVFSQVNVTAGGSLSTCGLWGISVKGGVPPYGAYIVATNSLIFTPFNSTSSTTRLTYKNRASPKAQMIGASFGALNRMYTLLTVRVVAIQDSTGVWGASTQAITTKGSPDTSCKGGVESSWIGDAQFETQAKALAAAQAQAHKTQQTTIALAIVFSFLGATILGLGLWYYFRYHRPVVQKFDQFDLPPPPPYDPEKGSVNSTQPDNVNLQASRSVRTTASATPSDDRSSAISGPMDLGRTVSHVDDFGSRARAASEQRRATYVIPDMSAASAVNSSPPRRANSTSPFPQGRQPSRKALEAAEERRIARDRVPPAPSLSPGGFSPYESPSSYVGPSQRQLPTPRRQPTIGSSYSQALSRQPSAMSSFQAGEPAVPEDEYEVDGAIVIQHRDASTNRIVVELPPAYAPAVNAREALDAKVASVNAGPSTVDDLGEGPYAF